MILHKLYIYFHNSRPIILVIGLSHYSLTFAHLVKNYVMLLPV